MVGRVIGAASLYGIGLMLSGCADQQMADQMAAAVAHGVVDGVAEGVGAEHPEHADYGDTDY